ncbi:hypothetical protein, partial [Melioribacter sp. OK-1-Me]|uniref:hypothetical protein n=1 Tax=Melioribacter sp. OK-1-Me TaxID=3461410 RepID=UPI00404444BD
LSIYRGLFVCSGDSPLANGLNLQPSHKNIKKEKASVFTEAYFICSGDSPLANGLNLQPSHKNIKKEKASVFTEAYLFVAGTVR